MHGAATSAWRPFAGNFASGPGGDAALAPPALALASQHDGVVKNDRRASVAVDDDTDELEQLHNVTAPIARLLPHSARETAPRTRWDGAPLRSSGGALHSVDWGSPKSQQAAWRQAGPDVMRSILVRQRQRMQGILRQELAPQAADVSLPPQGSPTLVSPTEKTKTSLSTADKVLLRAAEVGSGREASILTTAQNDRFAKAQQDARRHAATAKASAAASARRAATEEAMLEAYIQRCRQRSQRKANARREVLQALQEEQEARDSARRAKEAHELAQLSPAEAKQLQEDREASRTLRLPPLSPRLASPRTHGAASSRSRLASPKRSEVKSLSAPPAPTDGDVEGSADLAQAAAASAAAMLSELDGHEHVGRVLAAPPAQQATAATVAANALRVSLAAQGLPTSDQLGGSESRDGEVKSPAKADPDESVDGDNDVVRRRQVRLREVQVRTLRTAQMPHYRNALRAHLERVLHQAELAPRGGSHSAAVRLLHTSGQPAHIRLRDYPPPRQPPGPSSEVQGR